MNVQLLPDRRPIRPLDLAYLLLGVVAAAFWAYRNYSLPDFARGIQCGDAAEYLRLIETNLTAIFHHSSVRVFGYPFFLAIIRFLAPSDSLLFATLLIQVSLHLCGSVFLFVALRRCGWNIPYAALGLLFAHPALIGVNSLTLTDGITTSFTCFMIGTVALLLNNDSLFRSKSLVIGILFGIIISLRPSVSTSMWPFVGLLAIYLMYLNRSNGRSFKESIWRCLTFLTFYAVGFSPIYGHIVNNCHRMSGEYCVISSYHVAEWVPVSFRKAIEYSRVWGIVQPGGVFVWGSTEDRVLSGCDIGREIPTSQLLSCYHSNLSHLPKHFFRRIIGIFDNRHLNPYAALLTTPVEYWILRLYSLVGLVGVFASVVHLMVGFAAGTWPRIAYLSFPLLYLAIQVNFHGETRYIFPVQPLLFLLALYSFKSSAFPKPWIHTSYIVGSIGVTAIFLSMVTNWDALPR